MAGKGRTPNFIMGAEHRDKIKNSNILRYLIDHTEGRREMTQTQVTAGLALLKKVMPDAQPINDEGGTDNKLVISWQK